MTGSFTRRAMFVTLALAMGTGCQWVPRQQLVRCQEQCRQMAEQSRAQLAELENVKAHSRQIENELVEAEDALAGNYNARRRRGRGGQSLLASLAQQHPGLVYDPRTDSARYDRDLQFDAGKDELKPSSQQALKDLATFLASPDGSHLSVMIVGHTDDKQVARRGTREQFPTNQHLSVARAMAAETYLQRLGVPSERMAVSGFGASQPIVANHTPDDRRVNRRVEIFLTSPETPVLGQVPQNDRY